MVARLASAQKQAVTARSAGSTWRRPRIVLLGLLVVFVVALVLNLGYGAVKISPLQVVAILAERIGLDLGVTYTEQQAAVIWAIRLPRVLLGVLVGAGLAVAGAILQGIFRNPLAEPGLIGVSSGAALAAVATIVLDLAVIGPATLPLVAFLGGLVATFVVYSLARHNGRTEVVTLVLTGIAVNAVAGALTGFLTFFASDQQLRAIVFWTLGSLGGATWRAVSASAPFVVVSVLLAPRFGLALNLLALGEREAFHLGLDTERLRLVLIPLAALMTGAAVAVSGTVGFVGLVAPHLLRMLGGPDHRYLLPASALGGASLVLLADLIARTVVAPAELPLGVVMAMLGGPFFLWLIQRTRRERGGWG